MAVKKLCPLHRLGTTLAYFGALTVCCVSTSYSSPLAPRLAYAWECSRLQAHRTVRGAFVAKWRFNSHSVLCQDAPEFPTAGELLLGAGFMQRQASILSIGSDAEL